MKSHIFLILISAASLGWASEVDLPQPAPMSPKEIKTFANLCKQTVNRDYLQRKEKVPRDLRWSFHQDIAAAADIDWPETPGFIVRDRKGEYLFTLVRHLNECLLQDSVYWEQ